MISGKPPSSVPVPIVCPKCYGDLARVPAGAKCQHCESGYSYEDERLDLIVGERYDDSTSDEVLVAEEVSNSATTIRYWIPLFHKLWPNVESRPTILSLGCGVGTDVDELCAAGFNAMGVDCGKRSGVWSRRQSPERLIMANVGNLPFPDASFHCIISGCFFPHVGVDGASYDVVPDYYKLRLKLAIEITRVLKPGGRVITCNPNRWFPFDIFHGHTANHASMRPTSPFNPLLPSRGDYGKLFGEAGCRRAKTLPVEGYWAFTGSSKSTKGRLLSAPVRFLFWLVSRRLLWFLRSSFVNPWLIVMMEKD
jgi:SAM-dependent methyltransferase